MPWQKLVHQKLEKLSPDYIKPLSGPMCLDTEFLTFKKWAFGLILVNEIGYFWEMNHFLSWGEI